MPLYKFLARAVCKHGSSNSSGGRTSLVGGHSTPSSLLHAAFEPPLKEEFAPQEKLSSLPFFLSLPAHDNARNAAQHAHKSNANR